VQPDGGEHEVFSAKGDLDDGAGHELVTAYATKRPDGQWSVMLVNRDQENAHRVKVAFQGREDSAKSFAGPVEISTFGSPQYQWHPAQTRFMAHAEKPAIEHTVVTTSKGWADPDGPIVHAKQPAGKDTLYDLPAASVVVVRGKLATK